MKLIMKKIFKSQAKTSYNMIASIFSFYPLGRLAKGVKPKSERSREVTSGFSFFRSPFLLFPTFASSSLAWPGATHILMPGSNHGQMKNDGKTKAVLNRIYNSNFSDPTINQFWKTLVR